MFVSQASIFNKHHWAFSFRVFKLPVFAFYLSKESFWFRIFGYGLSATSKPLFSVRNGYKKSLKLGKFYFVFL
jgi:hypothetical protein